MNNKHRGLSMIEVLVALAITAVALLAASRTAQTLTKGAQRQEQVILAQLCAQNQLAILKLSNLYPSIGTSSSNCQQQASVFTVTTTVSATANPSFRRVQAQVSQDGYSVLSLVTIIGRY